MSEPNETGLSLAKAGKMPLNLEARLTLEVDGNCLCNLDAAGTEVRLSMKSASDALRLLRHQRLARRDRIASINKAQQLLLVTGTKVSVLIAGRKVASLSQQPPQSIFSRLLARLLGTGALQLRPMALLMSIFR